MTRHIILTLASDTTETECGACPFADEHCRIFSRRIRIYNHATGREVNSRLPECIAAESKPLGQMVGEEVERQNKDTSC